MSIVNELESRFFKYNTIRCKTSRKKQTFRENSGPCDYNAQKTKESQNIFWYLSHFAHKSALLRGPTKTAR